MPVTYTFGSASAPIPLSQLDSNFATPITLGNTAIQLGNTVTTLNNMTLANATVSSGNVTVTSASLSGNLTFTGTGNRITGDFSNATIANRVMFQTSSANSVTVVGAIPSGTGTLSGFAAASNSGANASLMQMYITDGGVSVLNSNYIGTGTYLPMTFYTGGSERMRIDTSGNVLVTSPAGLGYGTGSGGTVTQATNKSTAVTLNKPTGQITMNAAALAANTTVTFSLNNTLIAASDTVSVSFSGAGFSYNNYNVWTQTFAGGVNLHVRNISAGSLSEAIVLQYNVIKGATS